MDQNSKLMFELNGQYHPNDEVLALVSQMTRRKINSSNRILPPMNTDFGRHLYLGNDNFINRNLTMIDFGGIYLENHVFIGPNVTLLTVNHDERPNQRQNLRTSAIHVEDGAWLGANVTVLPGVTIGKNAIVGAGSLVTKDVKASTIVVGSPARYVKTIKANDKYTRLNIQ
ncbi:sugar O-acetyltransferase [Lactiplantibacillus paraplantarum]|uniref:Sugar O-acetyltransferase n=1 Tax=Lactiplantibacillus paraplantarum TaxID=60520 RepID=A0A4Q9Y0T1_9LACO|nr:sugar O-acetyltransferase [Lactiplantibacillus paraplantarum]